MASISRRPKGRKEIQFRGPAGRRQTVRLGKCSQSNAQAIKYRIERLVEAAVLRQSVDLDTARWLADTPPVLRDRLAAAGLCERAVAGNVGGLSALFLDGADVAPATVRAFYQVQDRLDRYLKPGTQLSAVTPAKAERFRGWLLREGSQKGKPLAAATASRTIRRASQLFAFAVRARLLHSNPFEGHGQRNETNPDRNIYVPLSEITAILTECRDLELAAAVGLARFAGLRVPSEAKPLTWRNIKWDAATMTVTAPKTKRYAGKSRRTVPLFAALRPLLESLWDAAPDRATLVLPSYQGGDGNFTHRLKPILERAGLELWPKPWINMRASAEADMLTEYPITTVAEWLGHSPEVAIRHYTRIAKEQAARAAGKSDAKSDAPHGHTARLFCDSM